MQQAGRGRPADRRSYSCRESSQHKPDKIYEPTRAPITSLYLLLSSNNCTATPKKFTCQSLPMYEHDRSSALSVSVRETRENACKASTSSFAVARRDTERAKQFYHKEWPVQCTLASALTDAVSSSSARKRVQRIKKSSSPYVRTRVSTSTLVPLQKISP